jgi:hypothetical protein
MGVKVLMKLGIAGALAAHIFHDDRGIYGKGHSVSSTIAGDPGEDVLMRP